MKKIIVTFGLTVACVLFLALACYLYMAILDALFSGTYGGLIFYIGGIFVLFFFAIYNLWPPEKIN